MCEWMIECVSVCGCVVVVVRGIVCVLVCACVCSVCSVHMCMCV